MITIEIDEHSKEDVEAIAILRELGMSDEEIQRMYNRQKEKNREKATGCTSTHNVMKR
jgi:hypothetical protein